jgi:mono/diheme cytochrome c family protein
MRRGAVQVFFALQIAAVMALGGGRVGVSYADQVAASKASVARGDQLVRLLCPSCHVVADNQEFPPILRQKTPSFKELANRQETTAKSLQKFLSTTHWDEKAIPMQMPNPGLKREEMQAVTDYILSLRKP